MILALDTATRQAGLALYDGESVRAESVWRTTDKHHTEWLVPAIENAFKQAGITAKALTAVAVTKGPGSYTGLRVALSVAKGLVAALGIPLVGVNALDVVAFPFLSESHSLGVSVPIGRGRFAYHFYHSVQNDGQGSYAPTTVAIGTIDTIVEVIHEQYPDSPLKIVGEFTRQEQVQLGVNLDTYPTIQIIENVLAMRRPSVVALLASYRLHNGESDDPHILEPIYLQPHA